MKAKFLIFLMFFSLSTSIFAQDVVSEENDSLVSVKKNSLYFHPFAFMLSSLLNVVDGISSKSFMFTYERDLMNQKSLSVRAGFTKMDFDFLKLFNDSSTASVTSISFLVGYRHFRNSSFYYSPSFLLGLTPMDFDIDGEKVGVTIFGLGPYFYFGVRKTINLLSLYTDFGVGYTFNVGKIDANISDDAKTQMEESLKNSGFHYDLNIGMGVSF